MAGESFGDPRLDALAYAVLAPSAHNRQPWLFRLDGDTRITVLPDLDRLLPQTDPYNRQIVVSFGAMLELLRMAAASRGYHADTVPFPDGEPYPTLDARPVAIVNLTKQTAATDPLMYAILKRRTNRAVFAKRDVERAALAPVLAEAGDRAGVMPDTDAVKAVCRHGWDIEARLARTHAESVALTRIGAREVAARPDGISLYGPGMEALSALGMVSREAMMDKDSQAHAQTIDFYNGLIDSAQRFVWLRSDTDSRAAQLSAGRDWVRMQLAATQTGLAFHPLSQALQEFPEMADPFAAIHRLAGLDVPIDRSATRLQGVFRLGYADAPRPSPRWPLTSRIIAA